MNKLPKPGDTVFKVFTFGYEPELFKGIVRQLEYLKHDGITLVVVDWHEPRDKTYDHCIPSQLATSAKGAIRKWMRANLQRLEKQRLIYCENKYLIRKDPA